jgi:hypothetical protein
MAAEDGPRLDAHSAVREFALHPKWRAPAITPDVPFCAALRRPAAVVLARCSAPERVRLIPDSGAVGGTHSTGCQARFSMRCSRDRWPPCLLLLLRPERHIGHTSPPDVSIPSMNRGPLFDGMWRRRGHPTSDGVGNTAQRSAEAKIASMLWLGDHRRATHHRGATAAPTTCSSRSSGATSPSCPWKSGAPWHRPSPPCTTRRPRR